MSDYTTRATVHLNVNGKEAEAALTKLKQRASDYRDAIAKAAAAGDKVELKRLRKDLKSTEREIKAIQSATINVADVLKRLDSATPKELKSTLRHLNTELNKMERGSEAWNEHVTKIHAVKKELESVNSTLGLQRSGWQKLSDWVNKWQTMAVAAFAVVMKVVSAGRNAVNAYAEIDQEMANTQKFTGMTREEVELLNEEFKKMDTRTSREGLNELAQAAGRLGKNSVEDVMGFVRAGDIIGVAMDELGAEAPQVISQLARIFNLESAMGTERAMLSVGSAINTLSQNCAASAPNLVDFAGRLGAIANSTNMTMDEMLAFGALLDDQKVSIEKSSTAIQGVITKMYANPAEFAKKAGMDANAFTEALKRSSTEGIMMFVESLARMDQMDQAATLKDLGTAGAGVVQTFQTLAGKVDLLKTQMQTSKTAFDEATSATEEYNVQNNTVQAGLDKANERFRELQRELGQNLAPVMKHVISSTGAIVRVLIEVISFVSKYKGEITVLTASIVAYNIAVHASSIKTQALAVAQSLAKASVYAWTVATQAAAVVTALLTGKLHKAKIEFMIFSGLLKANPIGLFVAGITAVVGGLALWITRTKEVSSLQKAINDATKKANSSIAEEKASIESLVFVAENERISMEKRLEAVNKLNNIIPDYNARIDETTGKYTSSKEALDAYLQSLEKKIRYEANLAKLSELIGVHENALDAREDLELALEEERKNLPKNQIHTSGHAATGASPIELFNLSADARRKALDEAITQAEADIDEFKRRMNLKLEKGSISPDSTNPTIEPQDNNIKCPKCGKSPCECFKDDVDDDKNKDRFKAENEWREREIAKARVLYATGGSDYENYRSRLSDIDIEYYEKLKSSDKAGVVERLGFEADYWEAVKKKDEAAAKVQVDNEKRRYDEILGVIKKRRAEGLITEQAFMVAEELLELEHLRRMIQCHEEGSDERIAAESRYYDALFALKQKRGEAWIKGLCDEAREFRVGLNLTTGEDGWNVPGGYYERLALSEEALKKQKKLKDDLKDDFFGLNADERQGAYNAEVKALKDLYAEELLLAGSNAEEKLRIEEAYQNALIVLRKKYNPKDVDSATPKDNSYIKAVNDFNDWLNSEGGSAVLGTAELVTQSMSGIFSQLSSMAQAELEIQTAAIERRYDKEISLAEGNSYKVAKLEKKKEQEIAKAKNEASKKQYAMQVIQTIAQTAIAGLNAYSSTMAIPLVGPALAPAAMALAIATGMLQVAALKKQQQAAEAEGYASGGFTPKGGKYEPAGIVHKGEWVASQELLASPVARPMIEALDYAQRTNTIGSLRADDVSRTITAPTVIASSSDGGAVSESLMAQARALAGYVNVIRRLNDRLDEPFVTVNTVTGDAGIKKAQDDYDKLMRNKMPKSKRKNI
ncbi:MAG: phage tail tape measure protein [Bacteroidales bacterium]|nr:phage tail tape measure protein [Bacteroidales bacterium]